MCLYVLILLNVSIKEVYYIWKSKVKGIFSMLGRHHSTERCPEI